MKALFVYYSHTGSLDQIAKFIGKENSSFDIEVVKPVKPLGRGFFSMLIGGRQAIKATSINIVSVVYNPEMYDLVVLASPVWASHVSPAMRRYINDHRVLLSTKKLGFLTISGGGSNDQAMNDMGDLIGRNDIPRLGLSKNFMLSDEGYQMLKDWFKAFTLR